MLRYLNSLRLFDSHSLSFCSAVWTLLPNLWLTFSVSLPERYLTTVSGGNQAREIVRSIHVHLTASEG